MYSKYLENQAVSITTFHGHQSMENYVARMKVSYAFVKTYDQLIRTWMPPNKRELGLE